MSTFWELAGLIDESGEMQAHFGGGGAIWVPPSADIAPSFSPAYEEDYCGERRSIWEPCLVYPTPSSWGDVVSSFELVFDPRELEEAGWIRRDDTTGLLEAFVALADGTPERIRRFVLKWGFLWRLSTVK